MVEESTSAASEQKVPKSCAQPTWTRDELVHFCGCCQKEFGLLIRKHHCRYCGKVFCDECTRFRAKIPHMGIHDMVRICEYCRQEGVGLIGPASWQRDSEAKACEGCAKPFWGPMAKLTKYHCCYCGKVFCEDCTRWYAKIVSLGYDKEHVRVCGVCKDRPDTFSGLYEWQRNADHTDCNQCHAPFTTTVRRHHCRGCGRIFCGKCLPGKALFPGTPKPQKVCSDCVQRSGPDFTIVS
eukprot:EG_transcript_21880